MATSLQISKAVADATLRGLRGPPNEIAMLGASNYLSETLKPNGTHHKSHKFIVENQPTVNGRGFLTEEKSSGVMIEASDAEATVKDAFLQTAELATVHVPPRLHDLKDIAARMTRELNEKETEVLRYTLATVDEIPENPAEPFRKRVFDMQYHTADCTLAIIERMPENTGLTQPLFASRHLALVLDKSRPYVPADFRIGATIVVYCKEFVIVDADERTRKLLASKYGVVLQAGVPEAAQLPEAKPVIGHVPKSNTVAFDLGKEEDPERGFYKKSGDTRRPFVERGTAMLKFECEWQEPGTVFSDRRKLALQYFLADDTIEILDRSSAYSSGGLFTKVYQRQRLPRMPVEADKLAYFPPESFETVGAPKTTMVLPDANRVSAISNHVRTLYKYSEGNTTRGKFTSPLTGRLTYTSDATTVEHLAEVKGVPVLTAQASTPAFVTAADLVCGGVISVYGRPLLIRSCDPFTVAYYIHNFGTDMRDVFVQDVEDKSSISTQKLPLPIHTGAVAIGSEEETRRNAGKLIPTYRSQKDFERYYQLGGKALKFKARFDPAMADPEDQRRQFIISYYLEDDTLMISELTGNSLGHGPSVTRFLNRGRYRNHNAEADAEAMKAVAAGAATGLDSATAAAYNRVFGAAREKIGYTENSGAQGYGGGLFGKAERVGPGGTGIESVADMGVRLTGLHSLAKIPRYFISQDFFEGARVQLNHSPELVFVLLEGDTFTKQFLAAREGAEVADPKDIFVPENTVPVPALPLESFQEADVQEATTLHTHLLIVAKILSGVLESAKAVIRQKDKAGRGIAPRALVQTVLASYGVQPPACEAETVDIVLNSVSTAAQATVTSHGGAVVPGGSPGKLLSTKPASRRPSTAPTSIGTVDDPLAGPFLRDFGSAEFVSVEMVDYNALFDSIKSATQQQLALQPRMEKLISQLRAALLSSRTHVRKIFRDLDVAGVGAITMSEFRHLLARHTLDVGISDAQLRQIMRKFAPAPEDVQASLGQPAISWDSFVEVVLDAKTLPPEEMRNFLSFVRGLKDKAETGVGGMRTVPQVRPQVNLASSWTPLTADPTPYLQAVGSSAPASRPSTAPSAISSTRASTPPRARGYNVQSTKPASSSSSSTVIESAAATQTLLQQPMGGSPGIVVATRAKQTVKVEPSSVPSLPSNKLAFGSASDITAKANHVVDAVTALRDTAAGDALLQRICKAFDRKRFDLYRALSLYDTMRKKTLNVQSFVAALTAAGLKLDRAETAQLSQALVSASSDAIHAPLTEHDVLVDYTRFFDDVFLTA